MTFDSVAFAIFLPLVLLVYYRLGHRAQNVFLLLASYVFYGWWDWRFLGLLWLSTVVDFGCGIALENCSGKKRPLWLLLSVCTNLSILGFFKYFNFFADSLQRACSLFGWEIPPTTLNIILPVGISFYTFQTMSYTIDVYRGQIRACRDFLTFSLYVSYFPQLVAGPIERASALIPQLASPRRPAMRDWYEGSWLIAWGLFKKVAVSNALAPTVDAVFHNPQQTHWWSLLWGLYFFSVQIYCDFSGYSDIARGTSRLLGISLMRNFWHPYFSTGFREFWRRWHISLSQWLRDYLYIPLGGSRGTAWQTVRNLFVTMGLGGLWHGASWQFLAWGVWHGALLGAERLITGDRLPGKGRGWRKIVQAFLVFHAVLVSWLLFRCPTWQHVVQYTLGLFWLQGGEEWVTWFELGRFLVLCGVVALVDAAEEYSGSEYAVVDWPWLVRGLSWGTLAVLCVALGGIHVTAPFIYFQF
ncbi:MAG: O-acyltransferase [Pirellulaceae bacterium]|nr:MAG: O-acyltransferase [Pirellulaceae bacterium]